MRKTFHLIIISILFFSCSSLKEKNEKTIRIASIMYKPVKWDKEINKVALEKLIREAKQKGAEIVVTTEGALEGYVVNEVINSTGEKRQQLTEKFKNLAETIDGENIHYFQELANELDIFIVLGFLESENTATYNTAIVLNPDEKNVGKYRKTHFAQGYSNGNEKGDNPPGYTRGNEYPVFDINGIPTGIMICFDRREPIVSENLVKNGAKMIINPAYGMVGDKNVKFISERAKENNVPIVFTHPRQTLFVNKNLEIVHDIRPVADSVFVFDQPLAAFELKNK